VKNSKLLSPKDLVVKNERKQKKKLQTYMTAYENLLAYLKSNNDMFINGHVLITKIDENANDLYLQNDCSILNMWARSSQNLGLHNPW